MGSATQYLRFDLRLTAPRASAQNHSPLTTQFKLYLDHQSLMKKDDAVCSWLKLSSNDS
ncbi:unnamed protein product [Spirodela intermedia]|uniref:Uncharacterized protein n=1 Tax=Spirodela intermedia TaxID=51605 RepID=A0A7I8JAD9_SPIIN|nr:unnamed protein product [Spirodela intermedia]CAA2627930.1 unnamed protein product [Spirodela intermedia]CAA6667179.1 unnamed protein product [Spirodela intermedia]CAA6667186.1 unnamed protein product [Spirodela intermedia]